MNPPKAPKNPSILLSQEINKTNQLVNSLLREEKKIYEGQAGSTPKSQTSSSKEPETNSTSTSSSDTDNESDVDKPKDSEGTRPHSATAQDKRAQLKGQKFLKKQYKKFDLISLAKPKKKNSTEEKVTTRSGRVVKKPDKLDF